jgi:hypothetical protein
MYFLRVQYEEIRCSTAGRRLICTQLHLCNIITLFKKIGNYRICFCFEVILIMLLRNPVNHSKFPCIVNMTAAWRQELQLS